MASWSELEEELNKKATIDPEWSNWLINRLIETLGAISKHRKDANVIFYASSFLQKTHYDASITREDMNGFMNSLYNTPKDKDLVLILHTPGGDPNAVESIVEYLHSRFNRMEVIVPYLAMSGGAMISLASDLLILGKASQLGPIDPQLLVGNKPHSARAIQEGFKRAKEDIENDMKLAHLWAPILQNMGPSLVLEVDKALNYSKELVTNWLCSRMFREAYDEQQRREKANIVASYFNAEKTHGYGQIHVHGQRVGAEKLKKLGLEVEFLEDDQNLQNDVLTAYHLMTLIFERTNSIKFIISERGKKWLKNLPATPAFS